ncbi:uncharacterized protein LOC143231772 [Tachypleus tridentatus]|uniref:uncharacterized protein LOC143231772 n=1 Tax=Tachypleus tridentatus TaxID=6853 RepID=UPI003FCF8DD9
MNCQPRENTDYKHVKVDRSITENGKMENKHVTSVLESNGKSTERRTGTTVTKEDYQQISVEDRSQPIKPKDNLKQDGQIIFETTTRQEFSEKCGDRFLAERPKTNTRFSGEMCLKTTNAETFTGHAVEKVKSLKPQQLCRISETIPESTTTTNAAFQEWKAVKPTPIKHPGNLEQSGIMEFKTISQSSYPGHLIEKPKAVKPTSSFRINNNYDFNSLGKPQQINKNGANSPRIENKYEHSEHSPAGTLALRRNNDNRAEKMETISTSKTVFTTFPNVTATEKVKLLRPRSHRIFDKGGVFETTTTYGSNFKAFKSMPRNYCPVTELNRKYEFKQEVAGHHFIYQLFRRDLKFLVTLMMSRNYIRSYLFIHEQRVKYNLVNTDQNINLLEISNTLRTDLVIISCTIIYKPKIN